MRNSDTINEANPLTSTINYSKVITRNYNIKKKKNIILIFNKKKEINFIILTKLSQLSYIIIENF